MVLVAVKVVTGEKVFTCVCVSVLVCVCRMPKRTAYIRVICYDMLKFRAMTRGVR
jgi:hypothetical protein